MQITLCQPPVLKEVSLPEMKHQVLSNPSTLRFKTVVVAYGYQFPDGTGRGGTNPQRVPHYTSFSASLYYTRGDSRIARQNEARFSNSPGRSVKYKIFPRGPFVNGPYREIPVYELSETDTDIFLFHRLDLTVWKSANKKDYEVQASFSRPFFIAPFLLKIRTSPAS